MLLFFDTETTGMVRWDEPNESVKQPRIVQLAALLAEPTGEVRAMCKLLVRTPAPIEPGASAIHGISDELLAAAGIAPSVMLDTFGAFLARARCIIAHNLAFDRRMLLIECAHADAAELRHTIQSRDAFCTMQAATPLCRLLKHNPRHAADYKWPKLSEAHEHFFGEQITGAHDALADVHACARVYFHLQGIQNWNG